MEEETDDHNSYAGETSMDTNDTPEIQPDEETPMETDSHSEGAEGIRNAVGYHKEVVKVNENQISITGHLDQVMSAYRRIKVTFNTGNTHGINSSGYGYLPCTV